MEKSSNGTFSSHSSAGRGQPDQPADAIPNGHGARPLHCGRRRLLPYRCDPQRRARRAAFERVPLPLISIWWTLFARSCSRLSSPVLSLARLSRWFSDSARCLWSCGLRPSRRRRSITGKRLPRRPRRMRLPNTAMRNTGTQRRLESRAMGWSVTPTLRPRMCWPQSALRCFSPPSSPCGAPIRATACPGTRVWCGDWQASPCSRLRRDWACRPNCPACQLPPYCRVRSGGCLPRRHGGRPWLDLLPSFCTGIVHRADPDRVAPYHRSAGAGAYWDECTNLANALVRGGRHADEFDFLVHARRLDGRRVCAFRPRHVRRGSGVSVSDTKGPFGVSSQCLTWQGGRSAFGRP